MKGVPLRSAKRFVPWAMAGFAVNLLTGLIFFISQPQQYATNLAMWLKVLFLFVAGINAMLFETSLQRPPDGARAGRGHAAVARK